MHNILFVASEMVPFVKTGGLGDVVGALPKSLVRRDVCVKVIVPLYSDIDYAQNGLRPVMAGNCVQMGNCQEFFSVHQSAIVPNVEVFFIEFNKYFQRAGIYDCKSIAFQDNGYRYAFFCRAALQVAKDIGFQPQVIHCHDWQTALIPYYLKRDADPFFRNTHSLLTIHNLPYQGKFTQDVVPYAKIDWADFHPGAFEDYGCINFLKGGIRFADKINTVSPNYAREMMTPAFGAGLDFLLRERRADVVGILNGIDTQLWNPEQDGIIVKRYSYKDFHLGKQRNKQELVKRTGLESAGKPVFGMAVRLAEQKGIGMLSRCIEPVLNTMQAQFVIMGQGEQWAQDYLASLPKKYPGKIAVHIGMDAGMEHLIDAGADFSLVPSLYEPCGLKQMISQTYGALPIVRATGGLEDTVLNYNEYYGVGTGFKFRDTTAEALYNTIGWANATYYDRPRHMHRLRYMAMKQNYSWASACENYQDLYKKMSGGH